MDSTEFIMNSLNIRHGEKRIVILLLGYSFCIGTGLYIYYTAATTLFLSKFDGGTLPVAYIAGGFIVYIIAQLNSKAQKHIKFSTLSISLVVLLSISIALLLVAYNITLNKWLIFTLYLWIRINLFVFSFTFWITASRLFDLGQAKRLYSLVGVGEVLASIVADFIVTTLIAVRIVTVEDLLIIALFFIAFSLVFLAETIRRNKTKLTFLKERVKAGNTSYKNTSKKYIFLMYSLGLIPIACLYIIEFSFSIESKRYFPDKEQLAIFLGQYLLICSITELLVKAVLFRLVTKNYGVMSGLILMPISLAVITILLFLLSTFEIKIFFLILISRFSITSIRRSFSDTSYQLLYQPISTEESITLQNQVETYAKPLGYVVAGLSMLLLLHLDISSSIHVYSFLVIYIIAWVFFAFQMQDEYKKALLKILNSVNTSIKHKSKIENSIVKQQKEFITDIELTNIMLLAESPNSGDRVKAAKLLENVGRYQTFNYLVKLLKDKTEVVRGAAIKATFKLGRADITPYLMPNLTSSELRSLTQDAIVIIGEPSLEYFNEYFNKYSYNLQVLHSLIECAELIGSNKSIRFLRSKLTHPSSKISDKIIKSLSNLKYKPNSSEKLYLITVIDFKVDTYLWLLAAEGDLKSSDVYSKVVKSLQKDRLEILSKLLDVLTFIRGDDQFDRLKELIVKSDAKAKSYLLDLVNVLVESEEIKSRILILFDNLSDFEVLLSYQDRYPQQTLSPEKRLLAIINKDNLNVWTKALALKQLLNFDSPEAKNMFAATITAQNILLSETSYFGLMTLNPDRFKELASYINDKRLSHHNAVYNKVQGCKGPYDLTVSKVEAMLASDGDQDMDYLIKLSAYLKPVNLRAGTSLFVEQQDEFNKQGTDIIIVKGSLEVTFLNNTTTVLLPVTRQPITESTKDIKALENSWLYIIQVPLSMLIANPIEAQIDAATENYL